MFAKSVICSDEFLDMPAKTQVLYFNLAIWADDDGFVDKPKQIMRMADCSEDDMKRLIENQLIIRFDSGIIVIKHWKVQNQIRNDRYHPSIRPEKALIKTDENSIYQIDGIPDDTHTVYQRYT